MVLFLCGVAPDGAVLIHLRYRQALVIFEYQVTGQVYTQLVVVDGDPVYSQTSGTAPNRVFTVEWKDARPEPVGIILVIRCCRR